MPTSVEHVIPGPFRALVAGRPADVLGARPIDGDTWLARLPNLIEEHLARWDLTPDGDPWHGENALVLPVLHDGQPAVVKVGWPHHEADLEHLALRLWDGHGAVRLIAANPAADALLLERLDASRPLTSASVLDSCETIGGLFRSLDREGSPQFPRVADKARRWRGQLAAADRTVPRRLAEQAHSTLDDLLAGPVPGRLVHEDLHDANVLAPLDPARGDWLAIDPKPVVGEWAYAVAPVVWNRADVAARAHNLRAHVRLRADVVADAAGLDLDRAYAWTFVRLVLNAVWAAGYAPASDDFRGRMITLAKAFADPPD
ncbi:kinase [Tessaracoccus sp. MC1756]|nr:kinase [Tessaracoccus sp. MC1756]